MTELGEGVAAGSGSSSGSSSSGSSSSSTTRVLEIGFFFDGTGNNLANARGDGDGSYDNAPSNVALHWSAHFGREEGTASSAFNTPPRFSTDGDLLFPHVPAPHHRRIVHANDPSRAW